MSYSSNSFAQSKANNFSSYASYLHWLKQDFFQKVRRESRVGKPVLLTGFITDQDGVIAVNNRVPADIANDLDWQAVIAFWSPSDVFVTGMKYLQRVIQAIRLNKPFQNTLFSYDDPNSSSFLKKLSQSGVSFFPDLGRLRQRRGLRVSPDIFVATTNLVNYADVVESKEFRQIVEVFKGLNKRIVVIKPSAVLDQEQRLAEKIGVEIIAYAVEDGLSEGQGFINAIVDYGKNSSCRYKVISNTTGPSVKKLFEQASYSGLRFYVEVVVVSKKIKAVEESKSRFSFGNPVGYLLQNSYKQLIKTPNLSAISVSGDKIRQSFNVFVKN
ncbi:MAG: hypothetical protein KatS3mg090_0454 [Patescibacteria group bacterium]|nr:MAG: hypothetical protein KatS3mg090_0454 [Patescibacteria group bacterium]